MKILLLCPSYYSLDKTLIKGLEELGHRVYHHNYRKFLKSWQDSINVQIYRLPYKYRYKWEKYYFYLINKKCQEVFDQSEPDIVFIYNNEGLLPETLQYFKDKKSKIIFFLGDSPYYTPTNRYYLHLLFKADMIVSPDSFWAEQLKLLGINHIIVDFPVYDHTMMMEVTPTAEERIKFNCDLLFVGTGYADSWGYKRALFISKFAKLNLQVFGSKHWLKWLEFFPELKDHFEVLPLRTSNEKINIMSKCSKVYPVDANPAILNGVHLRIFDCIGAGILPIVEYRKDHDEFFKGVNLPLIKNYNDAESIAKTYIQNDSLRESTLRELKEFIDSKYQCEVVIKRIFDKLK